MKILFFIRSLRNSAGTERLTALLANEFSMRGYDVSILCWVGGTTHFFPLNETVKIYKLFDSEKTNIYKTYLTALIKYRNLQSKIKPDVTIDICTASSLLSIPLTLLTRAGKIITWEHFNTSVKWNRVTSDLSRWLAGKFASCVVVLTDTDKENFIRKFKAENVIRILNPIPIIHNISADLSQKRVIAVGRLTNQKGFDLLIMSWASIIDHFPDWELIIIGNGELKNHLENLAKNVIKNNTVSFVEPTLNIQQYYKNASIFVLSSRFEGLPLVLLEAKSFGLPIVSFDCETGPRDVVIDNIDGYLVKPENIVLFAEKLSLLMSDEKRRREFGANAKKDLDRFSLYNFFNEWDNLIKSLN